MQKAAFIHMMHRQSPIGSEALESIEALCVEQPWCSTFQLLKTIALRDADDIGFKAQLNLAAAYAGDRSKLYDYVIRKQVEDAIEIDDAHEQAKTSESDLTSLLQANSSRTSDQEIQQIPESTDLILSISSEPLDEQIMREAMMHIGAMETERSLQYVAEHEPTPTHAADSEDVPESFGAWLLKVDGRGAEVTSKKAPEKALIEKFIQESPQITPVKKAFFSPSQMGKLSLIEDESFVSETLAKIYERQGDYKKAIRAYTNLGLKYPGKSSYFAALQKQAEAHLKNS
jgi:hypothetical protein